MLSNFAYREAIPFLAKHFTWADEKDILGAAQSVYWYARLQAAEWVADVRAALPRVQEDETFKFLMYILMESRFEDACLLVPFFEHPSGQIRKSAIYTVGLLPEEKKAPFVDNFRRCLHDPDIYIKCTTVEALRGLNTPELLPAYEQLLTEHPQDDNYLLSYVMLRLDEMGKTALPVLKMAAAHPDRQIAERANGLLEKYQ